jgi:sec-independent protein translocase protein TatC
MTAADGDDDDRPAGDASRSDGDSNASSATSDDREGSETGTDDSTEGAVTPAADGGEVTTESGEVTPEHPGSSSEVGVPTDDSGLEGAPDDQEMPLTEHIEEMLGRMLAVAVVMGVVSALVFPIADSVINFLWYSFLPAPDAGISQCGTAADGACPRVYNPLGLLFARLKVASLAGLILALPVFVYQTYLFMRPGLYPHERRYYLAAVPTSLLLALVGVAFAYFLILPVIFVYFLNYSEGVADIAFALTETFDLIILMMGLFALIFQIPLFIMLAVMMGVTTRRWLEGRRLLFWFSFGGIAFLFSPDPTGMAPLLVALTMIILFELTLGLLRWTGR